MKDFYPFWGEVYNLKSEEIIIIVSFINILKTLLVQYVFINKAEKKVG